MQSLFNTGDTQAILGRLEKLTPESRPHWGSFTAPQLVCHLADPMRVALGEKTAAKVDSPLGMPGLAHLAVWVLPWPKGAPTAPEFLPGSGGTEPTEFEQDKKALLALVQRFAAHPKDRSLTASPVFGRLGRQDWGRLLWRHFDHHLDQFGL